ncbi:MAG: hypothetical protein WD607_08170 [Candidatus Paceibacterota bacterium]
MGIAAFFISFFALLISAFSFWYGFLKQSDPIFSISRWTALGISNNGKNGSTFILKLSINNPSTRPITINDFAIIAKTGKGKRIIYEPLMLWDLTYYIESLGVSKKIVEFQKGQIPLPLSIPAKESFQFDYEILFMPQDKKASIINAEDGSFVLEFYALTDKWKDYKLVSTQKIMEEDIKNLQNGSFSGVLSTTSIENRKKLESNLK